MDPEKFTPRQETAGENLVSDEANKENLEKIQKAGQESRHEAAEQLDDIKRTVEAEAVSGPELAVGDHKSGNDGSQPLGLHQELKKTAYDRSMTKVRSRLSPPERTLSKVVHQPAINVASTVAAQTVARPKGILVGGIFAFIGSIGFLFFAKNYGFEYNYLLFIALFVIGYTLTTFIELATKPFRKSQ